LSDSTDTSLIAWVSNANSKTCTLRATIFVCELSTSRSKLRFCLSLLASHSYQRRSKPARNHDGDGGFHGDQKDQQE